VRSLGQNAAMLLGGYADPRTGQPMLDLEGAREMIDMLDILREKNNGKSGARGRHASSGCSRKSEAGLMEMTKAASAATMQDKVKSRT